MSRCALPLLLVALTALLSVCTAQCDLLRYWAHTDLQSADGVTSVGTLIIPDKKSFALTLTTSPCTLLTGGTISVTGYDFSLTVASCVVAAGPAACGSSCSTVGSTLTGSATFDSDCLGGNFTLAARYYTWTAASSVLSAGIVIILPIVALLI